MLRKDAVGSTVRRRNGLQNARRARHANASSWCSHGVCDARVLQAAAAANGRFDRIFAQRLKLLRKDAVESTVCRRGGLQNA
eukprot:209697-Lingulodinium_polyedra.AAC.1